MKNVQESVKDIPFFELIKQEILFIRFRLPNRSFEPNEAIVRLTEDRIQR